MTHIKRSKYLEALNTLWQIHQLALHASKSFSNLNSTKIKTVPENIDEQYLR